MMDRENKRTLRRIYKALKKASDKDIERFFVAVADLVYEDTREKKEIRH